MIEFSFSFARCENKVFFEKRREGAVHGGAVQIRARANMGREECVVFLQEGVDSVGVFGKSQSPEDFSGVHMYECTIIDTFCQSFLRRRKNCDTLAVSGEKRFFFMRGASCPYCPLRPKKP